MHHTLLRVLGLGALLSTTSAHAVLLTFNSQPASTNFPPPLYESGYVIDTPGPGTHYVSWGASFCSPACPQNGSNYLLLQEDTISISPQAAGSYFSLLQFDGAEAHQGLTSVWAERIRVTGYRYDNTVVTAEFTLDGLQDGAGFGVDFQTFSLPSGFSGLTAAVFEGVGLGQNWFSADNLLVEPSAVPLPAGAWLLGSGLAALLGLARRRGRPAA